MATPPSSGRRLKVAILGSGNIGADLLVKVSRSLVLECILFIGRNLESKGMRVARDLGVPVSDRSIDAVKEAPGDCELVFDATSAKDHVRHAPVFAELGLMAVDMTPSRVGRMIVPAVDGDKAVDHRNVNMVSCGGQASIPLAYAVSQVHGGRVEYVEVVSSIASRSAGPATRINLDEYIETTEAAIQSYSKCRRAKTILILNPAEPCIDMQTTVSAVVEKPDMERLETVLQDVLSRVTAYVPGYELAVRPVYQNGRIFMMARVRGRGDYLPRYAGNLDIINCAAIATAERYARKILAGAGRKEESQV